MDVDVHHFAWQFTSRESRRRSPMVSAFGTATLKLVSPRSDNRGRLPRFGSIPPHDLDAVACPPKEVPSGDTTSIERRGCVDRVCGLVDRDGVRLPRRRVVVLMLVNESQHALGMGVRTSKSSTSPRQCTHHRSPFGADCI
jgi:hypothetical protein